MSPLVITTLIIQIILSLILIVVVLFQSSNQEGLSGSIAGGAETFFGKNKGRTLDAKMKKWTAVVAVLFLISSVLLGMFVQNENKPVVTTTPVAPIVETVPEADGETAPVVDDETATGEEVTTPDEPEVTGESQD